jgi:hypothetical protein
MTADGAPIVVCFFLVMSCCWFVPSTTRRKRRTGRGSDGRGIASPPSTAFSADDIGRVRQTHNRRREARRHRSHQRPASYSTGRGRLPPVVEGFASLLVVRRGASVQESSPPPPPPCSSWIPDNKATLDSVHAQYARTRLHLRDLWTGASEKDGGQPRGLPFAVGTAGQE